MDIDLDIDNYELEDILKLFHLDYNFGNEELKQAKRLLLSKGSDETIRERANRWFGQRLCIWQISSIAISCKA